MKNFLKSNIKLFVGILLLVSIIQATSTTVTVTPNASSSNTDYAISVMRVTN